jgi:serine/threonine protein kinase
MLDKSSKSYGPPVDVWAIGCLLNVLLSGDLPFVGYSDRQITKNILEQELYLFSDIWFFVSEESKDLLRMMLNKDPSKRPSAGDCLKHSWFEMLKKGDLKGKDLSQALTNLYEFHAGTKLKQSLLAFFTKNLMTDKEVKDM